MVLIEWLRQERLEKGFKLSDLAQITGLSHATLSRVENQRMDLTLFTAVRMMHSLGLSWTDLFGRGFVREGLVIPIIYRQQNNNNFEFPCFVFSDFDSFDGSDLFKPRTPSKCCAAFLGSDSCPAFSSSHLQYEAEKYPSRRSARRLVDTVNFLIGNPLLSDVRCRPGWTWSASKLLNDMWIFSRGLDGSTSV